MNGLTDFHKVSTVASPSKPTVSGRLISYNFGNITCPLIAALKFTVGIHSWNRINFKPVCNKLLTVVSTWHPRTSSVVLSRSFVNHFECHECESDAIIILSDYHARSIGKGQNINHVTYFALLATFSIVCTYSGSLQSFVEKNWTFCQLSKYKRLLMKTTIRHLVNMIWR